MNGTDGGGGVDQNSTWPDDQHSMVGCVCGGGGGVYYFRLRTWIGRGGGLGVEASVDLLL